MARYFLKGVNGQLTVEDDFVVIERKGFMATSMHGFAGQKKLPIHNIMSVQVQDGTSFSNGYIQFAVLGGIESKGGILNASLDENSVLFKTKDNELVHKIRDHIYNIIMYKANQKVQTVNSSSAADEIIKYKKLLDAGIITAEEFEAKKKELLAL